MAFRKKVRSDYFPSLGFHRFGDYQQNLVSVSDGVQDISFVFLDSHDLSLTSLPLMTLDSIISSGQVIKGNVSFAPTDPAIVSKSVVNSVLNYSNSIVSSQNSDSHEG